MSKPLLVAFVVLTILLAACGGDKPAKRTATTVPEASRTTAVVADTSAILLPRSVQALESASGYNVDYTIKGSSGQLDGKAAYRGGATVYVRTTYAGDVGATDLAETLFLPPDLYYRQGDGTWFVQSPWNLGVRPGEPQPADPNEPVLNYNQLISNLRDIDSKPDEAADGRTLSRYAGKIDLTYLPSLAGKDARGTATATILIDRETSLPARVEIKLDRAQGFTLTTNFDYDSHVTAPAAPAARPLRDAQFPDAPCTGEALSGCLEAQRDIQGAASCDGAQRRVCIAPLGKISPELVQSLVGYYRDQFGLTVTVLKPSSIPADLEDPKRQQVAADKLIDYMGNLFPDAYRDPQAVLIGLTPMDVYDGTSQFRYVFGVKGTPSDPKAVVSSSRMDPLFYSEPKDDDLFYERTRKLVSKYIGLLYYQLPPSSDPTSPMYDHIGGPSDVDRMTEPLPVPGSP